MTWRTDQFTVCRSGRHVQIWSSQLSLKFSLLFYQMWNVSFTFYPNIRWFNVFTISRWQSSMICRSFVLCLRISSNVSKHSGSCRRRLWLQWCLVEQPEDGHSWTGEADTWWSHPWHVLLTTEVFSFAGIPSDRLVSLQDGNATWKRISIQTKWTFHAISIIASDSQNQKLFHSYDR